MGARRRIRCRSRGLFSFFCSRRNLNSLELVALPSHSQSITQVIFVTEILQALQELADEINQRLGFQRPLSEDTFVDLYERVKPLQRKVKILETNLENIGRTFWMMRKVRENTLLLASI